MADGRFEIVDARTVRDPDGVDHDVLDAIDQLPWVDQLCPLMRHQYAVLRKSPEQAWFVLDATVRLSPDAYRAYFRGYPRPNRYWDGPDGLRYWRTGIMLNRCHPDSVEPPRRVSEGAKPAEAWDGPPWAPSGCGIYVQTPDGKWWPTAKALASGYQPCRACQRRPADLPA